MDLQQTERINEEFPMHASYSVMSQSKAMTVTGLVVSALPALFLLMDGVMKLPKPSFVVKATTELGYSESVIVPLGVVLLTCTVLYVIPRTAIVGAMLLTGYLGGAVATHVRAGQGVFEIAFPVLFGALLWLGLTMRMPKLRAMLLNR
jgi:hypothetical protein